MFFYSSAISARSNYESRVETYFDGSSQFRTEYAYQETGETYAEESVGSSRSGFPAKDTSYNSGRSAWASTSTGDTQAASFTTQNYVTDAVAGTSFGDISAVTGTYVKGADGAGRTTSRSYVLASTQTAIFGQTFAMIGTSPLSGTASATEAGTQTYSTTAAQPGTVFLYGGAANVQLFDAQRGPLPPQRVAGKAFAVTHSSLANSAYPLGTISGTFDWISNFYFRPTFSTSTNFVQGYPPNFTLTLNTTLSYEYFVSTQWSTTGLTAALSAIRKKYVQSGYIGTAGMDSVYSSFSVSPLGLTNLTLFVPVFPSISSLNIFTRATGGLTLDGSSASAAWTYTGGAWSLRLTKANSSSFSTLYGTIDLTGSNATTTENASAQTGNTTAVLGPIFPATAQGVDEVSITLREAGDATRPFFFFSAPIETTFLENSSSLSASSSLVLSLGASYPISSLRAYKKHIGISFSTETTSLRGAGFSFTLPGVWQHSKWNEAGRTDAVSVNQ